jgi:GMP synthase (glutamine-hydrolysing)
MTILIINNYFDRKDQWKAQAIADRLRGLGRPYCKILDYDKIPKKAITSTLEAIILSGSPGCLSEGKDCQKFKAEIDLVPNSDIPVLGICFGHQLIGKAFGSEIKSDEWVKDFQKVEVIVKDDIFACWKSKQKISLFQNHKEYVKNIPPDFTVLAKSETCEIEAMKHNRRPIYGVQAHIERFSGEHPEGSQILKGFLHNVVDRWVRNAKTSQCDAKCFRRKVEESERKYGIADCIYNQCIGEFSNLGLDNLNKTIEDRILRPFLLTWGTMGRVLGYEGISVIRRRIQSLKHKIEPLRKKELLTFNLFENHDLTVELFNQFKETRLIKKSGRPGRVGPTASSKILHLTCPDLFVMWDSAIRKNYGKLEDDGEEYFQFLLTAQTQVLELEETIGQLSEKYGKKSTRIVDQFNLNMARESSGKN